MKKTILLVWVLCTVCTHLFAQAPKITWGADIEADNFIGRIFLENDKGIYTLAIKKDQLFLQLFDTQTLTLKKSTEIILPAIKGVEAEFEHVYAVGGNIVVFASSLDKDKDLFNLAGFKVSPELVIDKKPVDIFSIPVENKRRAGDFGFVLSADSNMIMVYNTRTDKKLKTQTSSMKVLHPALGTVSEVSETFPLKSDEYVVAVKSFLLDATGNIMMVVSQTDYKGIAILDRNFSLYYYDRSGSGSKVVTQLDTDNAKIAEIMVKSSPSGALIATGFYSEFTEGAFSYAGIAGMFYLNIDPAKGEIRKKVFSKFDATFTAELLGSRRADKGKLIPNFYIPRQLEVMADGSAIMTAEFFMITQSASGAVVVTSYYFNDVVVARFLPDGKMQWAKHLIKEQIWSRRQVGVGAFYGGFGLTYWFDLSKDQTIYYSYLLGKKDNTLCFIYNDHPENATLSDPKQTKTLMSGKKGIPVIVTVTPDGKMTKTSMYSSADEQVVFRPGVSLQTSDNRIIVYGSRKDVDKLGILNF